MKRINLITLCAVLAVASSLHAQNLTQATIERTSGLEITVYAKATTQVPAASNVLVLFAVSLPGATGPSSLTGVSLIGGTITPQPAEIIGGRKVYPFSMESPSSTIPISNSLPGTAIAKITFPTSESGDFVQINDYTGTGTTNGYWYISYGGSDGTNYVEKFYGDNISNSEFGDSYAEATLPLPVSLVSFSAKKFQDRSTHLSWATVSEINSSHFLVQRSSDKKSWSTIGRVSAAGNSQFIENYQFIDENVYNGLDSRLSVYYRLQMVDLDGQQKNSPIENVVFGKEGSKSSELALLVYPNPATDGVQVEWNGQNSIQPTLLELYDITGKLVLTQKVSDNANQEYIDFGPAKISSGLYLLRILNGSEPIDHQQIVVGQDR